MPDYSFLAASYDALTYDVPYAQWADYLQKHLRRYAPCAGTIVDLACGTGSLTRELALRGYEMIGVDRSQEMLAQAADKCADLQENPPLFLCQAMQSLNLYGSVDACVCCLDSINYLTSAKALEKTFQRVHLFLNPNGVFIFDVHAPEYLASLDKQIFIDEQEDLYCIWSADFSKSRQICTYYMDVFRREGETQLWQRGEEVHRERAYSVGELTESLQKVGFHKIQIFGDRRMRAPTPKDKRLFFVARKDP